MATQPFPLKVPPGIVKSEGANVVMGRYTDSDKIVFYRGRAQKWAGWERTTDETLLGTCRGALSWSNKYAELNAAFGTTYKLYVLFDDATVSDITPIRSSATIDNNPIATTSGSPIVSITHTGHTAAAGSYVTFSGATAVGGITISGEYQITSVTSTSVYTITHSSSAASSATGGGASVLAEYQLDAAPSGILRYGWGGGGWGDSTWGTSRLTGVPIGDRTWSMSEYGNDLLASPFGGGIYLWEQATDARAEVLAGAPVSCRFMFVTPERFIFALGAGPDATTPMRVRWPDQDDPTDWEPTDDNSANIRDLQSGSVLVGGIPLSDGVSAVWSDTSLYIFQYTGGDFVYDSRLAGTHCGLIAPLAVTQVSGVPYWVSQNGFHLYAGGVQFIPNSADVKDYVFGRMAKAHVNKMFVIYDRERNVIRWHYCATGSTEPDSYVDVAVGDWVWTVGTLDRTGGTPYRESDNTILLVDPDGVVYSHGIGVDADGEAMEAYLEYGLYEISNASMSVDVMGIIPECAEQVGDLDYEIYTKERPNSAANLDEQTVTMGPTDEIGDARVAGRHFGMTVRSNVVGGDFRLGVVSLEIGGSGKRR